MQSLISAPNNRIKNGLIPTYMVIAINNWLLFIALTTAIVKKQVSIKQLPHYSRNQLNIIKKHPVQTIGQDADNVKIFTYTKM